MRCVVCNSVDVGLWRRLPSILGFEVTCGNCRTIYRHSLAFKVLIYLVDVILCSILVDMALKQRDLTYWVATMIVPVVVPLLFPLRPDPNEPLNKVIASVQKHI